MTDRNAELDAAVRRFAERYPAQNAKRERLRDGITFTDLLALLLVVSFIASLPLLVWKTIPEGNKETIVYILGQISGMALTVVGFYFVSKSGDKEQNEKRAENTSKTIDALATANEHIAKTNTTVDAAADGANAVANAAVDRAQEIEEGKIT